MSALQAEVYEAFREVDVPEGKALKAAIALSSALTKFEEDFAKANVKREDEIAKSFNKRDSDIEAIRKDVAALNVQAARTTVDLNLVKWMLGTTLATILTVLFRVFTH